MQWLCLQTRHILFFPHQICSVNAKAGGSCCFASKVGFLRSSPHDMWSQIVSSCRVCPVHSGMLGNFLGPLTTKFQEQHLFPKTYSHLLVLTTKNDFRPCQHPLLSQVTPNWELLVSRKTVPDSPWYHTDRKLREP